MAGRSLGRFRFRDKDTEAHGVHFAGQVMRIAPQSVYWRWCYEGTNAQRSISELCHGLTEKLTARARESVQRRADLNRKEMRQVLQDQPEPPRRDRPPQQPLERPAASFGGFKF